MRPGVLLSLSKQVICDVTLYDLNTSKTGVLLPANNIVELPARVVVNDQRDLTYAICYTTFQYKQHVCLQIATRPTAMSDFIFPMTEEPTQDATSEAAEAPLSKAS